MSIFSNYLCWINNKYTYWSSWDDSFNYNNQKHRSMITLVIYDHFLFRYINKILSQVLLSDWLRKNQVKDYKYVGFINTCKYVDWKRSWLKILFKLLYNIIIRLNRNQ